MAQRPKEKAEELVEKFKNTFSYAVEYGDSISIALECASIAVDEILNVVPELTPDEVLLEGGTTVDYFINEEYTFWQQVKAELEKK